MDEHTDHAHDEHAHDGSDPGSEVGGTVDYFERPSWDERYEGTGRMWSGSANPQLTAEASRLTPGTALDVGCGEGGDVVWLARNGWQATGADFSANGLARTLAHAAAAGVRDHVDVWQVDARAFDAAGRVFDLVTCHFLHPASDAAPSGGMAAVTARLSDAVAVGGHLLIVGHAPSPEFAHLNPKQAAAMFTAAELLPALPDKFEVVVCEQRPRTMNREGHTMDVHDSTLLVRRAW